MNNNRRSLIVKAFRKLDKSGDGVVTVEDLQGVYNVKNHKKYISGEWTEEECLREFLDSFDTPGDKDGQVSSPYIMYSYSGTSLVYTSFSAFIVPFITSFVP